MHITLPLATRSPAQPDSGCGGLKPSRMGRRRAAVLIAVHVVIALHITQWLIMGKTLTPLEPSEAGQTLRDGLVNAGFVLFGLAILSTLLLGRFFCGWTCHLVALQDLCTWLLKKLRLRPKPFRSRLLIFVPLGAALYMFVLPAVGPWLLPHLDRFLDRWVYGVEPRPLSTYSSAAPIYVAHFTTDDFWITFPGWTIGLLTFFVCGFLIVYLLGNKGFCTYACPYGGFFGPADLVTPGRIRVTDACDGCGHCTATCTSNVRVHEEVRDYRMVVDPGCMKCLDCVSVCPKQALYYGFTRPSVFVKSPSFKRMPRRYDFTWAEELYMAAVFGLVLFSIWGPLPFLLSLGSAVILAYLAVLGLRLFTRRDLRLHGLHLRTAGRLTRNGAGFIAVGLLLLVIVGNLFVVQTQFAGARYVLGRAEKLQVAGAAAAEVDALTEIGLRRLQSARAIALFPLPQLEMRIGYLELHFRRFDSARRHLERALALAPRFAHARYEYSKVLALGGEYDRAIAELKTVMRDGPDLEAARRDLLNVLLAQQRTQEALEVLADHLERRPNSLLGRLQYADVLRMTGRRVEAEAQLRWALAQRPALAEGWLKLGVVLIELERPEEALTALRRCVELAPQAELPRVLLAELEAAAPPASSASSPRAPADP